jgi:sortase A
LSKVAQWLRKISSVNKLSLGLFITGIVCICWAVAHIQAQTVHSTYAEIGQSSTFPIQTTGLTTKHVASLESSQPIAASNAVKLLYPVRPVEGDVIGGLTIPSLRLKFPIIEGTNENDLKRGVGHFVQSVLPGEDNNSVLSGHRDTVFWQLGTLKVGDRLIVQTSAGTFTYVIKHIRIVQKDNRTVIVPTDHAVLTLSTCYPFIFVGAAPKRYIITSDLVSENEASVAASPSNR